MRDWLAGAEDAAQELFALRRELHRMPELGNREYCTAAVLERELHALGIETRRLTETGVLGVLRGALPGKCAVLRADMDALPVTEATSCDFTSENPGVMHACGHDIHMTAAIGAARLLSEHRAELRGEVRFLFQPDEEGDGGAARMIAAGCLDGADAVFGAHVSPALPLGQVGVRYGKFYAAADTFDLTVRGVSCHGAEREKGIDALAAAAALVPELIALPGAFPGERCVVSVGTFSAGTARNVIADTAALTGIIRTLGQDARTAVREALVDTVRALEARTGVTVETALHEGYPGVVNHDGMTRLAQDAAEALFGPERVSVLQEPTLTTEDFGFFLLERPGCFYHIGAGCPLPLHNAGFLPDGRAAVIGSALHAAVIDSFLST